MRVTNTAESCNEESYSVRGIVGYNRDEWYTDFKGDELGVD